MTKLSDERTLDIIELLEKGVPQKQIAKDLKCSTSTIWRVKKEYLDGNEEDMSNGPVIAGDKLSGTLTASRHGKYVGTCKTRNGKMVSKTFFCDKSREAIHVWEIWKQSVLSPRPKEAPVVVKKIQQGEVGAVPNNKPSSETPDTLYILAVGAPKIAGYYKTREDAEKAMYFFNKIFSIADVSMEYSIVEVEECELRV